MSVTERVQTRRERQPGSPFGPPQLWIGVGVGLLIVAVAESVVRDGGERADALLPTAVGATVPVTFVNRLPRLAAATSALAVLSQEADSNVPTLASCVVAVALVLGAASFHLPAGYSALFASPFVFNAASPFDGDDPGAGRLLVFVVAVGALGFGALLRSRVALVAERDASVAAHDVTRREQALLAERSRIARELHDVVAHHVSAIAIQAETARFVTPGLTDQGAERFAAIGDSARAALDEMRRLLGVMRTPGAADLAPQPGLGQLHGLIDEHRSLGGRVRFSVRGAVASLPAATELVAYRVVQEALTNVRRHAPGASVDASLDYTPTLLRIAVRDDGPGRPPSAEGPVGATTFGLIGMRERIEAAGGTLTAGDHPDGGFEIVADLPVGRGA